MPQPDRSTASPANLCELLLRDVASLLVTSRLINQFLRVLRPECGFSPELTATVDDLAVISDSGATRIHPSLVEAGAVLPATADHTTSALITGFLTRLPVVAPGVLAAEISVNLRLLAQHVELRARLAAETALLVGQSALCRALIAWSAEWRNCGRILRAVSVRARAQAYVADLDAASFLPAT